MNDASEDIKARFAPGEADVQVKVVDSDGRVLGTIDKLETHVPLGILHRAFSLFLFDKQGHMLLQRRVESKHHLPLLLTNATCSHPLSGKPATDAVERHVKEELGADVSQLERIGIIVYQVVNDRSRLAEHEYNHVYTSIVGPKSVGINPDEVDKVVYVAPQELAERRADEPMMKWFNHVWGVDTEKLSKYGFSIAGTPGIHSPAEAQAVAQSVSERNV